MSEDDFEALVEGEGGGDLESISGSESEGEGPEDAWDALLEDPAEAMGGAASTAARGTSTPFAVFRGASAAARETVAHLGVYRSVLLHDRADDVSVQAQQAALGSLLASPGRWCILLARGGHFAGAIFDLRRIQRGPRGDEPACIAHKSFHRYVIRAKQGGRQASKDATGKVAKSAGSALRRYNEAQLAEGIRETLGGWAAELSSCDRIFVQVSRADRATLFGGPSPCLSARDPRVRRVPFATQRPTFSEAKRVALQLGSVFDMSDLVAKASNRL